MATKSLEFAPEDNSDAKQLSFSELAVPVPDDQASEKLNSNPFLDPKVEAHYRKVYEDAKYECRHVFDPHFEWTAEEERRIVRKLDWRVSAWACIMFFALNIDRKNLASAVSDNMLDQLNLSTNDYNYGKHCDGFRFYA